MTVTIWLPRLQKRRKAAQVQLKIAGTFKRHLPWASSESDTESQPRVALATSRRSSPPCTRQRKRIRKSAMLFYGVVMKVKLIVEMPL